MTPEDLDSAIGSGDLRQLIRVLAGATEPERRASAEVPNQWNERSHEYYRLQREGGPPDLPKPFPVNLSDALRLAILGTAHRPES